MKKLLLLILFLAVIAGVYYAYTHTAPASESETTDEQVVDEKKPADPRITAAWEMMVGTWSSEDDRNVQLEITDAGTYEMSVGTVDGEVKNGGDWSLFTADNADDVSFQLNNTDVYVKQVDASGMTRYSRVMSITPTEMELMDMETATAIRYGKMPTGHELQDGIED